MLKLVDYMKKSKEDRCSHLLLEEPCIVRGTTSTHCRGILAHFLDTDMNTMKVDCCHACNNEACSNPRHLYWGTRSENVKDLHKANPLIKQKYSKNKIGKNNHNYGIKPWRNVAIQLHPGMIKIWESCEYIYDNYYVKGWDFSKYGRGESYFEKTYGFSRASISKMWKMFSSWNPHEDNDYQEWKRNNSSV